MPGFGDLVLILIVALFIFGTSKLPMIATVVGKAIVKVRRRSTEQEGSDAEEVD